MSEHGFPVIPTAAYGIVLLAAAVAYTVLQGALLRAEGDRSLLRGDRPGSRRKGLAVAVLPRHRAPTVGWSAV
jgi:hypothetical protein